MRDHISIFLDTNIVLHFRRPDEIDWLRLAGTHAATLVISPALVRELDGEKVTNRSAKLRRRAADILAWFRPMFRATSSVSIRPNVEVAIVRTDPTIDFASQGLNRDIQDDWLIAAALTFVPVRPGPVAIATNDAGMELKLPAFSIEHVTLPEDMRLQDQTDELEKENERLRGELSRLSSRVPRLELGFKGAAASDHLQLVVSGISSPPTLDEVYATHPKSKVPKTRPLDVGRLITQPSRAKAKIIDLSSLALSEKEQELWEKRRHNDRLDQYYEKHRQFLANWSKWAKVQSLTFDICPLIANTGSAPANNIDIVLTAPPFIGLIRRSSLPSEPKRPKPPEKNKDASSLLLDIETRDVPSWLSAAQSLSLYGEHASLSDHSASYRIKDLKQHDTIQLGTFCILFPSSKEMRSFAFQFHITANELPDPVEGVLHVVRPEVEASEV